MQAICHKIIFLVFLKRNSETYQFMVGLIQFAFIYCYLLAFSTESMGEGEGESMCPSMKHMPALS